MSQTLIGMGAVAALALLCWGVDRGLDAVINRLFGGEVVL